MENWIYKDKLNVEGFNKCLFYKIRGETIGVVNGLSSYSLQLYIKRYDICKDSG